MLIFWLINFLCDKLLVARPDYGWLSEESPDNGTRLEAKKTWMIDPIDGTKAFINCVAQYTISIALIDDGVPIIGVIYNPETDELFYASQGNGAFKNGVKIKSSEKIDIPNIKLLGEAQFFHSSKRKHIWQDIEIIKRNSIAYRMALIASGEFDAAITLGPNNDWDIAAGIVILKEAGGLSTDLSGKEYKLNQVSTLHRGLICANAQLLKKLVLLIEKSR